MSRSPIPSAALVAALAGCTIGRYERFEPIPADPETVLVPGKTTKAEVLAELGAPTEIHRQWDGDLFMYRYVRRNIATLEIAEPYVTRQSLFVYDSKSERHDRLAVFFDRRGVVSGFGITLGTEKMPAVEKP
ncbi:MAG: hypothetical protein L0216_15870 [Planctomycetales bacterium]|nr:hypothetical protein [Planctomycetales bacterium]